MYKRLKEWKYAFTMAEILISLTIIGIIAAITLPALRNNINETAWTTQRKALYSRMSQAIAMMPSLNGYGVGATDSETVEKATQAFITDGLSKVFKISNICDYNNLKKCGFPNKITKMGINSKIDTPKTITELNQAFDDMYSLINTKSAAFETENGESILTFYNPNCSYTNGLYTKGTKTYTIFQPTMCVNFIFDLNGLKGPNRVGKDIGFMTVFYPTDSEFVAPYPIKTSFVVRKSGSHEYFTIGYGQETCRKEFGKDTKMANIYELESVFVNSVLGYHRSDATNFLRTTDYYSSSLINETKIRTFSAAKGILSYRSKPYNFDTDSQVRIFCVKR